MAKLVHSDGKDRFLLAAVVSSLNRENFRTFVERPEIASRAGTTLLPQLIATAVGFGDEAVMTSLLKLVTTSENGTYQVWQFTALESLLDAWKKTPNQKTNWLSVEPMLTAARTAALDSQAKPDVRVAATRLFGKNPNRLPDDITQLGSLLVPQTPSSVQAAAVGTLGRLADDRAADALLNGWTGYSPALQSQVMSVLLNRTAWIPKVFAALKDGRLPVSAIPAGSRQGLLTEPNESIRKQAEAAFAGAVTANRQALIDEYRTNLPKAGNAARGKETFQKVCATCHQVQGVGHAVGPDLTALASKSADYLLTEILDPNRNLDNRYLQYSAQHGRRSDPDRAARVRNHRGRHAATGRWAGCVAIADRSRIAEIVRPLIDAGGIGERPPARRHGRSDCLPGRNRQTGKDCGGQCAESRNRCGWHVLASRRGL